MKIGDIAEFKSDTKIQDFCDQGFDDFEVKAGTRVLITNVIGCEKSDLPIRCQLVQPKGFWSGTFLIKEADVYIVLPI